MFINLNDVCPKSSKLLEARYRQYSNNIINGVLDHSSCSKHVINVIQQLIPGSVLIGADQLRQLSTSKMVHQRLDSQIAARLVGRRKAQSFNWLSQIARFHATPWFRVLASLPLLSTVGLSTKMHLCIKRVMKVVMQRSTHRHAHKLGNKVKIVRAATKAYLSVIRDLTFIVVD